MAPATVAGMNSCQRRCGDGQARDSRRVSMAGSRCAAPRIANSTNSANGTGDIPPIVVIGMDVVDHNSLSRT